MVESRCLALMHRLRLVFGCLDFIVTPEGEHVFLEINPMGQFLWLEERCPSIPLLDAFVRFCETRDERFHYRGGDGALSLQRLRGNGRLDHYLAQEAERHLHPHAWHVATETSRKEAAPVAEAAS